MILPEPPWLLFTLVHVYPQMDNLHLILKALYHSRDIQEAIFGFSLLYNCYKYQVRF